jgi:hypothetical protein
VRLQDGRVLVMGGYDAADNLLASAELFDPATNTFSPSGEMTVPRKGLTPILLPDGRVLIIGGSDDNIALDDAEVYDPATGTFEFAGFMTVGRYYHQAVVLPDGRVALLGGYNSSGPEPSVEIYDPATETFERHGRLRTGRAGPSATLLPDGRLLVAGGQVFSSSGAGPQRGVELYDPKTGQSIALDPLPGPRRHHIAISLGDGRVLIVGGAAGTGEYYSEVLQVDTQTGKNSPVEIPGVKRFQATAVRLLDGRTLIAGGRVDVSGDPAQDILATAELYVPGN